MCYSAQIQADFRKYVKTFGAHMGIEEFARLYFERAEGSKAKIPKAIDENFRDPQTDLERQIKTAIEAFNAEQTTKLEQELFKQRTRLTKAERALETKVTKVASEDKRIATNKIENALRGLEDIHRTDSKRRDLRIFPESYAPVLVMEDGRYVVKPMRYKFRIAGKPTTTILSTPEHIMRVSIIWNASGSRALV